MWPSQERPWLLQPRAGPSEETLQLAVAHMQTLPPAWLFMQTPVQILDGGLRACRGVWGQSSRPLGPLQTWVHTSAAPTCRHKVTGTWHFWQSQLILYTPHNLQRLFQLVKCSGTGAGRRRHQSGPRGTPAHGAAGQTKTHLLACFLLLQLLLPACLIYGERGVVV